jgi:hypothetical protein
MLCGAPQTTNQCVDGRCMKGAAMVLIKESQKRYGQVSRILRRHLLQSYDKRNFTI